jgi:predicted ATPase
MDGNLPFDRKKCGGSIPRPVRAPPLGGARPSSLAEQMSHLLGANPDLTQQDQSTGAIGAASLRPDQVVRRRLDALPEPCLRVLLVGAVIGKEFDQAVVRDASRTGDLEFGAAIRHALIGGLVSRVAPTRYRFAHALIRETLYKSASPGRVVRLHAAVAEALERLPEPEREVHVAELAHHFFEVALAGGDAEKAILYATKAGDRATALLAYEQAAAHYQRALEALELAPTRDETAKSNLLLALDGALDRARTSGNPDYSSPKSDRSVRPLRD